MIAIGLVLMNKKELVPAKSPGRGPGRPKKSAAPSTPPRSLAATRNVAKSEGSVATPAGRRSSRIARKTLDHND